MLIHHECDECSLQGITCRLQIEMKEPADYLRHCPRSEKNSPAWDLVNPVCHTCDSTGIVSMKEDSEDRYSYLIKVPCPDCDGTGFRKLEPNKEA